MHGRFQRSYSNRCRKIRKEEIRIYLLSHMQVRLRHAPVLSYLRISLSPLVNYAAQLTAEGFHIKGYLSAWQRPR